MKLTFRIRPWNKPISIASRKKTTVKSEVELEKEVKLPRRKQNKQLKVLQQSAKKINSSYLVAGFIKNLKVEATDQVVVPSTSNAADLIVPVAKPDLPQSVKITDKSVDQVVVVPSTSKAADLIVPVAKPDLPQSLKVYDKSVDQVVVVPSTSKAADLIVLVAKPDLPQSVKVTDKSVDQVVVVPSTSKAADLIVPVAKPDLPQSVKVTDKSVDQVVVVPSTSKAADLIVPVAKPDLPQSLKVTYRSVDQVVVVPSTSKAADLIVPVAKPVLPQSLKVTDKSAPLSKSSKAVKKQKAKKKPAVRQIINERTTDDSTGESSEYELSEDESSGTQSIESYIKEVKLLKERLQRKNESMKKLKARNKKLELNSDINRELNVHWQRKQIFCTCNIQNKKDDAPVQKSLEILQYSFNAEQQMILAGHTLPLDINKFVCDMASFLFDEDEFKTTTAAKLDKSKITFMHKYLHITTGFLVSEPGIKEILNKKRLNSTRVPKDTPPTKRMKMSDDVDLNDFLLVNMQENDDSHIKVAPYNTTNKNYGETAISANNDIL